ncbi:polysaccharide biosynthesis tyrosine autokinase [Plantibacter sp. VKM Ac-2876]|uniref:polysaccharide biosynthesis tyrosine autokinase n=1 Tax=Plantibacter sp. VKM Ac-2876 TaxID=2783826 RepID=UPI00188B04FB|nr:polysaccharide biosynthesis tyrosine autokinase [Plantibacter sp. VKM Ac-2876]MBF4565336.1 polysaccharide biosynthesis tyrosine autokinase [Plantibacter sp. VKM Ac-2876]
MDLKDYLRILRHRWLLIVAITLGATALAHGYTLITKPAYQSTGQLFVAVTGGDSVGDLNQGNTFAQSRVASYVILATGSTVRSTVADRLDLDPVSLIGKISASNPAQSVLINISAVDSDPVAAARIANTAAQVLVDLVDDVESANEVGSAGAPGDPTPVGLTIVEPASPPRSPVAPNVLQNLAVGVLTGLALGVGITLLIEVLDTRLRGRSAIEKLTDTSILGAFHTEPTDAAQLILGSTESYSRRAESFRQLRTHLQFVSIDGGLRSVMVTSSVPGEGKSTTAANLALVLAEAGNAVLLVDADLRRPRQHEMFGLEDAVGLTTVLTGRISLGDASQAVDGAGRLAVLTSGELPPNPSELLGSAAMERALSEMERAYDVVVIDTPPLINVSDPTALSTLASGVLLVASADGRLHRDQLRQSLENLSFVQAKLLGVVLNRLEVARGEQSSSYAYYHRTAPTRRPRRTTA